LSPNLGVVKINSYSSFVVADIPGLIPGASEGIGLGIEFLKHLSRVEILLHLIDVEDGDSKKIRKDFDDINKELEEFSEELKQKDQWVVISKIDKISEDKRKQVEKESKKLFSNKNVFYVSSISGSGLEKIIQSIGSRLANEKN